MDKLHFRFLIVSLCIIVLLHLVRIYDRLTVSFSTTSWSSPESCMRRETRGRKWARRDGGSGMTGWVGVFRERVRVEEYESEERPSLRTKVSDSHSHIRLYLVSLSLSWEAVFLLHSILASLWLSLVTSSSLFSLRSAENEYSHLNTVHRFTLFHSCITISP